MKKELYKELEEKPYIDAFNYIEQLGEKTEDKKLIKINRFLKEDRKTKDKEIERLNNIIKEAREYIEDVLEYEGKEYTRVIKETLIKILDKGEINEN